MPNILIVDDDDAIREFLRDALERAGYQVIEAANGFLALELLDRSVDLVITDIIMPDMEGIEFILKVFKRHPGLPILAISGGGRLDAVSYLQLAQQLGATRILSKPFTYKELTERVAECLKSAPAS